MKKKATIHRNIAIKTICTATLLLPLLLFSSCYDDLAAAISRTPVRLSASAEQPQTRAKRANGDLDIQNTAFDEDELIAVYIKDEDGYAIADASGNEYWPAIFEAETANTTTHLNSLSHTDRTLYYPTDNKKVNMYAYYPSTVDVKAESGTALKTTTTFTVATDQTGSDDNAIAAYKGSDLMFSKITDQARTSGTVNLNFTHKMVKFIFNVVADGDIDIGDCYLTGVNNSVTFNPTNGDVTNPTGNVDIKLDNSGAVVIPPQTLSGTFIAVHGTARKEGYTTKENSVAYFSLKYSGGGDTSRTLEGGKVYTVNLSVGYNNFGSTYEIGKWNEDAGIISVAALDSGGFSIVNESIYTDTDYEIEYDNDNKPVGYKYTGGEIKIKPTVKYGESKILTLGTDYELQYFGNVHVGKATVLAIGIGGYEGYAVAASFNITQIPSSLKFTEPNDSTVDKETLELPYVRNYTINPTNVTPQDIHLEIDGNGTMSYAISRKDGDTTTDVTKVAEIDSETGVITLKGTTGEVKVTATMAADKDYLTSSDSFILKVTKRVYDPKSNNIRAYFTDKGVEGGSPSYTYDGNEHKPAVTVEDYVDDTWVDITSSCSITYPDGGINASNEARVTVTLGGAYEGTIPLTYTIEKATPNLRIYEGGTTNSNLLNPQGLILYLSTNNTTNSTTISRTRIAATDFGTATFRLKSGSENTLFTVSESTATGSGNSTSGTDLNTTGVFKAKGTSTGNLTYQAYVEGSDNWNEASIDFTVSVFNGLDDFEYKGWTQQWECKAPGTYLLEVWGAQGGNTPYSSDYDNVTRSVGGGGAYVSAVATLTKDRKLYVNVGGAGGTIDKNYSPYLPVAEGGDGISTNAIPSGTTSGQEGTVVVKCKGWNGGGAIVWGLKHSVTSGWDYWKSTDPLCGGGGATDISLNWKDYDGTHGDDDQRWQTLDHLLTRIIVAGGGGGSLFYSFEGNGAANGSPAGAWEGTISTSPPDPGEGGTLYRGGLSALNAISSGIWNTHSSLDSYYKTAETTGATSGSTSYHYDGRPCKGSAACGIFGDGGYYTCVAEGGGAGGGGWYGGGSCGQQGGNGPGGGGSSYVWCSDLESYYPTLSELTAKSYITYHYTYTSGLKTPKDLSFPHLTEPVKTAGSNLSETLEPANGKARITCLTTTN